MDDVLRSYLCWYISWAEESICGEYHGGAWPRCDEPAHLKSQILLEALGAEPAPWTFDEPLRPEKAKSGGAI